MLITAPSLDARQNVSGISTLVKEITEHSNCDFEHFAAGRRDGEKAGPVWLLRQGLLPFRFFLKLLRGSYDLVHVNTALDPLAIYRDAVVTVIAKMLGFPVLVHIHGGRLLFGDSPGRFFVLVLRIMLRVASTVIILSDKEKDLVVKLAPQSRLTVLPNAVATDKAAERQKRKEIKTIVFIGRIHESKGLDEIVKTCRTLLEEGLEFQFRCYGAGPQEKEFTGEMEALLGTSFSHAGVVDAVGKWKALADADIFFLPSRFEGLPISLLEAMAAECVPVVSRVGSIDSIIEDGRNGFLVEPNDLGSCVEAIRPLLNGETDLAAIGHNARMTVVEDFDMKKYSLRLCELYENIK